MTSSLEAALRRNLNRFPRLSRQIRLHRRKRWHVNNRKEKITQIIANANRDRAIILAKLPENAISNGERKDIEHYAYSVWGSRKHAASLLLYRAFYGSFCEGWVPWSYYNEVLVPSFENPDLIGAKTMSKRFIPSDLIPDLAYYIRGNWSDADNQPLTAHDVADRIFADHEEVYVKTEMGGVGKGVFRKTRADFDAVTLEKLGNLSIQAPIRQHSFFDAFTDKSVATLRVTTVKPFGEKARAPGCHLRCGIGNSRVVNVKNAIEIAITDDEGTFSQYGSESGGTPDWAKVTHYPDTNLALGGLKLPSFRAARLMCEELHDTLPHLTIIGWDVVIDQNGDPKIIEINTKAPGFDGHQLLAGAKFTGFGWEDVWRK